MLLNGFPIAIVIVLMLVVIFVVAFPIAYMFEWISVRIECKRQKKLKTSESENSKMTPKCPKLGGRYNFFRDKYPNEED